MLGSRGRAFCSDIVNLNRHEPGQERCSISLHGSSVQVFQCGFDRLYEVGILATDKFFFFRRKELVLVVRIFIMYPLEIGGKQSLMHL